MKILLLRFFFSVLVFAGCKANINCPDIIPGAENMQEYLQILKEKEIGTIVNQTSLVGKKHLVDTLSDLGIQIKKIFTPEHGYSGRFNAGEIVENSMHDKNIPIISLYGKNKKPTAENLQGLEILVFDLQDVGCRFYTYLSTLHYIMEACAENDIELIVLDRPNPNAHFIDGPVLDTSYGSFVGLHPVPIVYGMTIGEYAQMINGEGWLEKGLRCKLRVVHCRNYTHDREYVLPVRSSPNLPDMRSVYLYPSLCLFEGTIVSVGRGTEYPFQVYGHPDYSKKDFFFIPKKKSGSNGIVKYDGEKCFGVDFRHIEPNELKRMKKINLGWILKMYDDIGRGDEFFKSSFNLLAGNAVLKEQIKKGLSEKEIRDSWYDELEKFKLIREKYLIYP